MKEKFSKNINLSILSKISSKEVKRYFDKILTVNPNLVLYESMIEEFIEKYRNNYEQKDLFEYATVNGYNKTEDLINKIFKI